jgi:hypothetical protein
MFFCWLTGWQKNPILRIRNCTIAHVEVGGGDWWGEMAARGMKGKISASNSWCPCENYHGLTLSGPDIVMMMIMMMVKKFY